MNETILFPSPNWFQVSVVAVSNDGWLIYGGPSKSLCILETLPGNFNGVLQSTRRYRAHVVSRAHPDKIVSISLSPEWPEKRAFLTGSADGLVKQWTLEQSVTIKPKSNRSHDVHQNEKEEVAGVGYANEVFAVTVGGNGTIVKWDLNSNVMKTFAQIKGMKPTCLACSQHMSLIVAIGTKQGVITVLDLNGSGKILYKVRGQDDEITNVSWCPQFEVSIKKTLDQSEKKFSAADRMARLRLTEEQVNLEDSGVSKDLPEDSFSDSIVVQEDDTFDIYQDHAADEFGHKKYVPEDIIVKIKEDSEHVDYLTECEKLKEEILKRKNKQEESIESLVQALDSAHIEKSSSEKDDEKTSLEKDDVSEKGEEKASTSKTCTKDDVDKALSNVHSLHMHKHLLATIGKHGSVRIWSKSGKLVASCAIYQQSGKNPRHKSPSWSTLLWYKADTLLLADGKSQLLQCNPMKIDCKNKLEWRVVHSIHKRGLYCIATNAPRVQSADMSYDDCCIWTAGQERYLVCYTMSERKELVYGTCGGFVYNIQPCPYDAGKVAISVGDGGVRIWETETTEIDDGKLTFGHVSTYWQNVQGKVLTVAWHPTRENWLAFATAESRIGIIETSGKVEKAARVLRPTLSHGIYSISWGRDNDLYACGGGKLVVYNAAKGDESPTPINIEWEGVKWEVSSVLWRATGLVVGSNNGAIAMVDTEQPYAVRAATFIYSKMIHTIDWHPAQTSSSTEESVYKNLIAVCSVDKVNTVVILEYVDKDDGTKQLNTWKTLSGHKAPVLQLMWNPHHDGLLLSTSQDFTVRVWNVIDGVCTSIFGGHNASALTAAWSQFPQLSHKVLSGGSDCCVRLWDINDHPADSYVESVHEPQAKKKQKKKEAKKNNEEAVVDSDENAAATLETKIKYSKKFLLPLLTKQMKNCSVCGVKKMIEKHFETKDNVTNGDSKNGTAEIEDVPDANFIKIFGTINEVNELLDVELARHTELGSWESWVMLCLFRGHVDAVMKAASQRDALCPFLLSMAPCVSLKYWKDTTQLYLAQIDRLVGKGEEEKLAEEKTYGGAVFRKAATLLSIHDVKGAVGVLTDAKLFKEAYVLCRVRYVDSIAEETLRQWAEYSYMTGNLVLSVVCQIALGDMTKAANILGMLKTEDWLALAAELAKKIGQNTFAEHLSEKREQLKSNAVDENTDEKLNELPTRVELLTIDCINSEVENVEKASQNNEKIENGEKCQNSEKIKDNENPE